MEHYKELTMETQGRPLTQLEHFYNKLHDLESILQEHYQDTPLFHKLDSLHQELTNILSELPETEREN